MGGWAANSDASPAEARTRFAAFVLPWPVLLVAGLFVLVLLAVAGAYGFHRDELYFIVAGQHPALGYVDQPSLTPLLSAASVAMLGVSPTAVRLLPAIEMALVVVLAALMARDLGGSSRAQVIAAVVTALSGILALGHLDETAEPDVLAWAVILWLLVRLLAGGDRRQWLGVGIAAGIGLENKDTILFLGFGLAVGVVVARRWDVLRSPWAWGAIGIAALVWLPNLAWQAANGWPQLTMAGHIAGNADDNRAQFLPLLWLVAGFLLFPVPIAGWAWLLLTKAARPWRAIGLAGVAALALAFLSGGKAYYAIGILPAYLAAGAVLVDRWLNRGHRRARAAGFVVVAALSGLSVALFTLPLLPPATFAASSLPAADPILAEQLGWPEVVRTVEDVVAGLPADERDRAVIFTGNYGEASALVLLGSGLPPVYSGHNSWWDWGPPPDDRSVVVRVGDWASDEWMPFFASCRVVASLDDGLGVPNEEQGQHVSVCTGPRASWTEMWPALRHVD